jgi:16S rRNA (guanine1516-N2)-methyltransferase
MSYYLSFAHEALREQALLIAQHFQLVLAEHIFPRLHLQENALVLLDSQAQSIYLDWNDAQFKQRAKGVSGRDPLIRASLAGTQLHILDLTAGWGKDGLLMAQAGSRVTMIEKNPYMAALLMDAHARLKDKALQSRIKIIWQEAQIYLKNLNCEQYPDVIYIDPMHPIREKSAQVKKHLQILQKLVAPNDDVKELIEWARQVAKKRVVLKWPAKAAEIVTPKGSFIGKTIRYNIY